MSRRSNPKLLLDERLSNKISIKFHIYIKESLNFVFLNEPIFMSIRFIDTDIQYIRFAQQNVLY